jgi:hypothetical protein
MKKDPHVTKMKKRQPAVGVGGAAVPPVLASCAWVRGGHQGKAWLTAYLATTAGVEHGHRWRGRKLKVKLHTMQYSVQYHRQQGQARQLLQELYAIRNQSVSDAAILVYWPISLKGCMPCQHSAAGQVHNPG